MIKITLVNEKLIIWKINEINITVLGSANARKKKAIAIVKMPIVAAEKLMIIVFSVQLFHIVSKTLLKTNVIIVITEIITAEL